MLARFIASLLDGSDSTLELVERIRRSDLDRASLDTLTITVERLCSEYAFMPSADLRREGQEWMAKLVHLLDSRLTLAQHREVLVLAGWLALLAMALRHPGRLAERQLVALLPLAALAGALYFATAYPTPDGDTVKGSFMLTAVPAWAACFGFGFDGLRTRFPRFSGIFLVALALLSLVGVPFLFATGNL